MPQKRKGVQNHSMYSRICKKVNISKLLFETRYTTVVKNGGFWGVNLQMTEARKQMSEGRGQIVKKPEDGAPIQILISVSRILSSAICRLSSVLCHQKNLCLVVAVVF
jgi:hypothetical protein